MINIYNEYLTIEEVSDLLRVSYLTVYRWIQDGKLESYKAGKQYRIEQTNLIDFLTIKKSIKEETLPLFQNDFKKKDLVKSPLNYTGGKYKLLKQILPLFPSKVNIFLDLFAGGCNIGINTNSQEVWFNDNLTYLINMYKAFQENNLISTLAHIENRISEYNLSQTNKDGYLKLRDLYNTKREPLDLFVLIAYSFNHQIRFNSSHKFNNPFGKERSSFNTNMKRNLVMFINKLQEKKSIFTNLSFDEIDYSKLSPSDFVYCDPPYLITTGSYNDGKRGFKGWTETEERNLLNVLNLLDKNDIKFALSNVLEHKGKANHILRKWLINNNKYVVHYLDSNYSNSNYHTKNRNKNSSQEILVTNY